MRQHLYADVFATCGVGNLCFIKNDSPLHKFSGTVVIDAVSLQDGATQSVASHTVVLPEGPGSTHWFTIGDNFTSLATDGNHVMNCSITSDDGSLKIVFCILHYGPCKMIVPIFIVNCSNHRHGIEVARFARACSISPEVACVDSDSDSAAKGGSTTHTQ